MRVRRKPGNLGEVAPFRDGQEAAIQHVVDGRGRLLVVRRTGWGKSSVYFIATKLLRDEDMGPAIPISPLLALMRNQIAGWLQSRGVQVESYSGETGDRRVELEDALLGNRVKALVATTALGMGFDKPDLAFVIHFQTPGSVIAYYERGHSDPLELKSSHSHLLGWCQSGTRTPRIKLRLDPRVGGTPRRGITTKRTKDTRRT